jgi:hypothetical protein
MMTDLSQPSASGILAAVEELPPEASGAFVVATADGRPFGAVLASGYRVCWAVVGGQNRRLRDLLQLPAEPHDAHALTQALADVAMRTALKQHTIESLVRMDGCVGTVRWVAHRRDGYRPHHTFGVAEVMAGVGAQLYAAETAEALHASDLDEIIPSGAVGASFAIGDDDDAVIVHEIRGERMRLPALTELGTWAIAALGITRGFSAAAMMRALDAARGPVAVAWRASRRIVHSMMIDEPRLVARVVNELHRRGLPAVLSTTPTRREATWPIPKSPCPS